jgi:hypothetical protein
VQFYAPEGLQDLARGFNRVSTPGAIPTMRRPERVRRVVTPFTYQNIGLYSPLYQEFAVSPIRAYHYLSVEQSALAWPARSLAPSGRIALLDGFPGLKPCICLARCLRPEGPSCSCSLSFSISERGLPNRLGCKLDRRNRAYRARLKKSRTSTITRTSTMGEPERTRRAFGPKGHESIAQASYLFSVMT